MGISELSPEAFQQLPALYSRSEHSLLIRSIAAGHTPARAWVNQTGQPDAALVWDRMSGLYLAGQPAEAGFLKEVRRLLLHTILPDVRERQIPELEVFYDRPAWEPGLNELIPGDLHPRPALFNSYQMARPNAHQGISLSPGFRLAPVDQALLARHDLNHLDHLLGWILSFYRTVGDFRNTGFGYVAIAESEPCIASLCITVFVAPSSNGAGQDYELGLATAPEYRQRGLAGTVAAACIRHAQSAGGTPVWHCWADNTPSASVAEKVGFDLVRQTPAIRFEPGP